MELAAVIYYTHYSFMIYGHARIPITSWLRDNATESLAHAQEAGQMIMRLHKRPALGIAAHGARGAINTAPSPSHPPCSSLPGPDRRRRMRGSLEDGRS